MLFEEQTSVPDRLESVAPTALQSMLTDLAVVIGNRFEADVCSIYLRDRQTEQLVLVATVGLKQSAVGKVRMRPDEGLVGLVAERRTPVITSEAQLHARFKYFSEAGEEPYESFFGFPIEHQRQVCGVLVIQSIESRTLQPGQEARLTEVGRQLGRLLKNSDASVCRGAEKLQTPDRNRPRMDRQQLTQCLFDVLLAVEGLTRSGDGDSATLEQAKDLMAEAVGITRWLGDGSSVEV